MGPRQTNRKAWLGAAIVFSLVFLTTNSRTALAQQWTTNGNHICNTNSGNVGIGTCNPFTALHILSGANEKGLRIEATDLSKAARLDFYTSYDVSGTRNWAIRSDTYVFGDFGIFQSNAKWGDPMAINRLYISNNGNVGIGTTSPGLLLDVERNINGYSMIRTGNNNGGEFALNGLFADAGGGAVGLFGVGGSGYNVINLLQKRAFIDANANLNGIVLNNEGAKPIIFSVLNSERMRVDSSGNVGIGDTAPAFKLDVAGVIRSSTGGFKFPDGTVQTTAVQGSTSITVSAGDGMSGGGAVTLGAGGALTLTNADKGSSQSIFKNVANAAGATQFAAGSNNDVLRFEGTGGTSVSFDNATKKVIINSSTSGATSSAPNVSAGQFGQNVGGGDFGFPANLTVTGNIGIGTTTPTTKLHVVGDGRVTGNLTVDGNIAAKYQDVAEWVPAAAQIPAGTVVVLDSTKSNQVISSTQAYDTRVAGVISEKPGIALGESGTGKVLVATTGRVRIKVDATRGPIHIGDLLVTSDISGMAMKSEPVNIGGVKIHRPGTLIGKALEPLARGKGDILVLLSLQ